jgi:hypothetical protein
MQPSQVDPLEHLFVSDLLGVAVLLGCDTLEIIENLRVRFLDDDGKEIPWKKKVITPTLQKQWSSDQIIKHLKHLSGVSVPHRNYRQEGGFLIDVETGGVVESVGVLVENEPSPLDGRDSPEILRVSLWVKPWIPLPVTWIFGICLPLFLLFAAVAGVYPLPFLWAWVGLFLGRSLNEIIPATPLTVPSQAPYRETGFGPNPRRLLRVSMALTVPCLPLLAWSAGSLIYWAAAAVLHGQALGLPVYLYIGCPVIYGISRFLWQALVRGLWKQRSLE